MARQPFFNNMPLELALLVGAIVLAHLARIFAPPDTQAAIVEALAVTPARWESALSSGQLFATILPSMFGHVFLHAGWVHLLFNMSLLVSVGRGLAENLRRGAHPAVRFYIIFFGAAAAGALSYVLIDRGSDAPALGASGAVCGIYSAYLLSVFPRWQDSLRQPAILQNGAIFVLINVGLAFAARFFGVLPIAWEAHLGGFIGGLILYPLLAPAPQDA